MTCHLVRFEYFLVFSVADPRADRCLEPIEDNVWLDEPDLCQESSGRIPCGLCVGRSPEAESRDRLCRRPADRWRAGCHQVVGLPVVVTTWDAFLQTAADCGEAVS